MSRLTKMLEYAFAGNAEQSRMRQKESFKTTVLDTIPKAEKELLISEGMNSTSLLQTEVYNTILEGAQPEMVCRNIFPTITTDTNQIRITYESGSLGLAEEVAEGAAIPIHTENFNTHNIDIKKIGVRPVITNELIEDGLWDMAEFELKRAGQKLEHKFNYDVIGEATDLDTYSSIGSTNAGGTCTVQQLITAIKDIHNNDQFPTDIILTPTAYASLISGSNILEANKAGDNKALRNYDIGSVLGLKAHMLTVDGPPSPTTSYQWNHGYDTAVDIGAVICDPSYCMIGMRRDLTIEQYDDPIHDLVGIAATMRFGVKTVDQTKAHILYH